LLELLTERLQQQEDSILNGLKEETAKSLEDLPQLQQLEIASTGSYVHKLDNQVFFAGMGTGIAICALGWIFCK
jgi:hypothetical protein